MMAMFVLFFSGGHQPEADDESTELMKAWADWFKHLGDAVIDIGNPFSPVAKTIGSNDTVRVGANAAVNGYSVVEADLLDEAVDMARGCPQLRSGGEVSVFETFDLEALEIPDELEAE